MQGIWEMEGKVPQWLQDPLALICVLGPKNVISNNIKVRLQPGQAQSGPHIWDGKYQREVNPLQQNQQSVLKHLKDKHSCGCFKRAFMDCTTSDSGMLQLQLKVLPDSTQKMDQQNELTNFDWIR